MAKSVFRDKKSGEEMIRKMVDLRLKGLSFAQVAEECSLSVFTVYKHYSEAASCDYCGYDPVGCSLAREKLSGPQSFSEVALSLGLSTDGLKNYMLDRNIKERTLPKSSEILENGTEAEEPLLKKFLEDGYLTQKFLDYYGITYYSGKLWAEACGIEVKKIPKEERSLKDLENAPKNVSYYGQPMETEELVNLRLRGYSFAEIGQLYGLNKASVYKEYMQMKLRKYDGYEPFEVKAVAKTLREEDRGLEEIARDMKLSAKGLMNYITDRDIPGRELPTWEEIRSEKDELRLRVAREYLSGERNISGLMKFFGGGYRGCRAWAERIRLKSEEE